MPRAPPTSFQIVYRLLPLPNRSNENPLTILSSDTYSKLRTDDQCRLIDLVSRLPCAGDGALKLRRDNLADSPDFYCSLCSGKSIDLPSDPVNANLKPLGLDLFSKIITHPSFIASKRPRVYAMVVLRRLTKHSPSDEFLDLEKSAAGQWCLRSLSSSMRELRVAAGRSIPAFICEPGIVNFDNDIIARNRTHVWSLLKSLRNKNVVYLEEAAIMAWAQVGRVAVDDELNIVVVTLVEYLGHRNTIVSDCAFNEILNLASARGEKPRELFDPFWDNLAFTVVKDLTTRPQTANKVAELLRIGVPDLLRLLQKQALPWLVLSRRKDVIQKIAEARNEAESWRPCLDFGNLPHILALLLVQDVPDPAQNAMTLLRSISEDFNNSELVDFLQTEPIPTALELFKAAADANSARRTRVRNS